MLVFFDSPLLRYRLFTRVSRCETFRPLPVHSNQDRLLWSRTLERCAYVAPDEKFDRSAVACEHGERYAHANRATIAHHVGRTMLWRQHESQKAAP